MGFMARKYDFVACKQQRCRPVCTFALSDLHLYQLPFILIALWHVDLINVAYLTACTCLYQVIKTLHFLNDIINDVELTQKSTIMSWSPVWKVNQLIEYQVRLRERMLNCEASQQVFSKPCLVNLISNNTYLVFSIYCSLSGKYNGYINRLLALQYSG